MGQSHRETYCHLRLMRGQVNTLSIDPFLESVKISGLLVGERAKAGLCEVTATLEVSDDGE